MNSEWPERILSGYSNLRARVRITDTIALCDPAFRRIFDFRPVGVTTNPQSSFRTVKATAIASYWWHSGKLSSSPRTFSVRWNAGNSGGWLRFFWEKRMAFRRRPRSCVRRAGSSPAVTAEVRATSYLLSPGKGRRHQVQLPDDMDPNAQF